MTANTFSFLLGTLLALSVSSSDTHAKGRCLLEDGEYGECVSTTACDLIHHSNTTRSVSNCSVEDTVCCSVHKHQNLMPEGYDNVIFVEKELSEPGTTASKWCNYYKNVCPCPKQKYHEGSEIAAIGGVPAKSEEFPHMAAIGYGPLENIIWQCGGSLISENYILTAAHCLSDGKYPAAWVRLGTVIIQDSNRERVNNSDGQTHPVIERIKHPGYKGPSRYNDIALLKIGPALEDNALSLLSKQIHPACLQVKEQRLPVMATGWGRLGPTEDPAANLQKVSLKMHDNSDCNKTYELEIRTTSQLRRGIDDSHICAGQIEGGIDTCKGDSGGPLQSYFHESSCLHLVIGITSFGKICGTKGTLGVYTRVKFYLDWIEEYVWKDREICSADNDRLGECLPLNNCTHIHQLIQKGYRPIQCGFNRKEPVVCCPSPIDKLWKPIKPRPAQRTKSRPSGEAAKQWCEKYKNNCRSTTTSMENLPKDEHNYPHLAFIGNGELNAIRWQCAGSLISENVVLTAAHCLSNSDCKSAKWIRLGSQPSKSNLRWPTGDKPLLGQVHPIEEVIIHPEYIELSKFHDLALLKIGDPVEGNASSTMSASIHPACLQVTQRPVSEFATAGIDSLGKDDRWLNSVLEANLTALNLSMCNITSETTSRKMEELEKLFRCTTVNSWGRLCLYNNEGPLQIPNYQDSCLYEVMGFPASEQTCVTDEPVAYTQIVPYLSWIEDNVWPST